MADIAGEGTVRLSGLRGRLARVLLGSPDLRHNGVPVDEYPERDWHLVCFPAQKGRPFDADNLATVMGHPFIEQEAFRRARQAAEARWPTGSVRNISWRLHVALWSVSTACRLDPTGDLVELGTGRGYMAAGIAEVHANLLAERRLVLVDRFRGEVPGTPSASRGTPAPFCYSESVEEVRAAFLHHPFIDIVQADLPEGAGAIRSERICWLHVDLNDPDVEVASLHALRDRLAPRALVLFDDSGNPGMERSGSAHLELVERWGASLLMLPTGQSMALLT